MNYTLQTEVIQGAGDPDELVADSTKAGEILGWKAQNDLEHIITNAWKWHQSHPKGY